MGLKNLRGRKNYGKMAKKALGKSKAVIVPSKKKVINPYIKKYVQQALSVKMEKKFFTNPVAYKAGILATGFNTSLGTGWNSANNIIPTIQQGVGQQQRIGNRVSTSGYITIRGHVVAVPTSAASNPFPNMPFYVRIVVWRQKQSMTTVSNTGILDDGITSGGGEFDGTLDDLMLPYNKDRFVIGGARQFMLQPNSTVGTYSSENLSRYPVSKFFKLRVPIPKTFVYNDTALDPSNCRWYMSAGIVNADGTLATTGTTRAQITADVLLQYQDA